MGALLHRLGPNTVRILALFAVLIGIILFFSTQIDNYLNARLFNRISTSVAIITLIAVGQAIVVLTRNIDLSVGSVVGCVAYFLGGILGAYPDIPPLFVPLIAIAIGACFGAFNGFLVSRLKLPSIIVTLATLAIFRSILVESSDGSSITTGSLPSWLIDFARMNAFVIGGFRVRWMVVIAVAVVVIAHIMLTRFRVGRQFYAVGSSPDAAEFAGINVRRTVMQAFLISGALAGLAGFMFLSRFGNITVVAGLGLELKSVGAVRGWRGQYLRWVRQCDRRSSRCQPDRSSGHVIGSLGAGVGILARCRAWHAHSVRRRLRHHHVTSPAHAPRCQGGGDGCGQTLDP